jgi:hypothetical protein
MAKVSKNGTNCTVTLHNDSTQNLLALEVAGEVGSPAFDTALDEPESRDLTIRLKAEAEYFKKPLTDPTRKKVDTANQRHESGVSTIGRAGPAFSGF